MGLIGLCTNFSALSIADLQGQGKLMRSVKWVFGGLAAVVVILGLAWVMVPKDRIINFALDRVEAQTGRDISVGGDA